MNETPKELDAAVDLIFRYKPPRFDGGPPDAEANPDEEEPEQTPKAVYRRTGKRRRTALTGISRVRRLMRRRRSRRALAR